MLTKFLLTALLAIVAWMVVSRLSRGFGGAERAGGKRRPSRIVTQATTKCRQCGIFLPAGETCGCRDHA